MSQLAIEVDPALLARVEGYAKEQGLSISDMVQAYLPAVIGPTLPVPSHSPLVDSVRGCMKNADEADFFKHIESKHRR
jgi:hypothetical protein